MRESESPTGNVVWGRDMEQGGIGTFTDGINWSWS